LSLSEVKHEQIVFVFLCRWIISSFENDGGIEFKRFTITTNCW